MMLGCGLYQVSRRHAMPSMTIVRRRQHVQSSLTSCINSRLFLRLSSSTSSSTTTSSTSTEVSLKSNDSRTLSTTTTTTTTSDRDVDADKDDVPSCRPPQPPPVGIFLDLDNVEFTTHSRKDAKEFVQPLKSFANAAGTLTTFQAFANQATQIYAPPKEKERRKQNSFELEQEFMPWDIDFPGIAQTGYDANGILRCGVCGARMKLTKKDRARGLTMERKLDKHMKMLHDREQEKRRTKKKEKGRKLTAKDKEKWLKYESAQVGLNRIPATRGKKQAKKNRNKPKKNDLFRILREHKIMCRSADDVDSALRKAATKWIDGLKKSNTTNSFPKGILVVLSRDSDFVGMLKEAKSKGLIAVSATSHSEEQTSKLVQVSDIVLTKAGGDEEEEYYDPGTLLSKGITLEGKELLMDMMAEEEDNFFDDDDIMDRDVDDEDEDEFQPSPVSPSRQQHFDENRGEETVKTNTTKSWGTSLWASIFGK